MSWKRRSHGPVVQDRRRVPHPQPPGEPLRLAQEALRFGGLITLALFQQVRRALEEELAEAGVVVVTERSAQGGKRQQAEITFSSLKRVFGLDRTLANTLVGLATRIVAKVAAYTYAFYVNRLLGRPQGRMKELWA